MSFKVYRCRKCSNVAYMINDSNVIPFCCDASMIFLKPNTIEASHEKHIPNVQIDDNEVRVCVGSELHPMIEEHYIMWIAIVTNKKVMIAHLKPNEKPEASFILGKDEKLLHAYAYCNIHELWMK